MKGKTLILILFLPLLSFAQETATIRFSLDTLRRDSFFLIETIAVTKDNAPRPVENTTPQLFKSPEQLDAYVSYLENEAKKATEQAQKYAQAAELAGLRAQLIAQLKAQFEWWGAVPPALTPEPERRSTKKKQTNKKQ